MKIAVKVIAALMLGLAVAAGLFWWIGHGAAGGKRPMMDMTALVDVEKVKAEKFEDRIEALGTVKARESVTLTATVTEFVDKIYFQEGQQVKKGQLLVSLEQAEEQATLKQTELSAAEEERLFQISKRLNDKQAVALTEYEKQLYAKKLAQAKHDSALAGVRKRNITAPFDGQVGIRQVSSGAMLSPGTAITTLDDLTAVKTSFTLPETYLSGVKVGAAVEARCAAYPDRLFSGQVTVIDTRVDSETRAVTVLAEFNNPDGALRPGMLMSLEVVGRSHQSPALPEKALLSYGERHYVFVVNADQSVTKRQIKIGMRQPGRVEVVGGIAVGDTYVSEGVAKIVDGQKVSVNNTAATASPAGPARKS